MGGNNVLGYYYPLSFLAVTQPWTSTIAFLSTSSALELYKRLFHVVLLSWVLYSLKRLPVVLFWIDFKNENFCYLIFGKRATL